LIDKGIISKDPRKGLRPEFVSNSDGGVTYIMNQVQAEEKSVRKKDRTSRAFTTSRALVSINLTKRFDKKAEIKIVSKVIVKPSNGVISAFTLLRQGFSKTKSYATFGQLIVTIAVTCRYRSLRFQICTSIFLVLSFRSFPTITGLIFQVAYSAFFSHI